MEEPEEVEEEERQGSNKEAICVEDDPNDDDDDCPKIYNMGGNAEMVLNKGVGNFVIITFKRARSFALSHNLSNGLFDERITQFHKVWNDLHGYDVYSLLLGANVVALR